MKQILFPTAYANHSDAAYRYAQRLAQYFEAGITLVHIYKGPSLLSGSDLEMWNEVGSREVEEAVEHQWNQELDKLKSFANELDADQFKDIPLDFIVTDGNVVDELLQIQEQNDFDLVVMGMRRHKMSERLFGNTTYRVIDEMECPVLLIPPEAHFMSIDKIVYGTAFQFGGMKAIDYLLEWCDAFFSKLHLLHVYQKQNHEAAVEKMAQLMERFQTENESGDITFQLLEGKIAEVMDQYVTLTSADVLVIHRRKQGIWQRITEGSLTKMLAEEVKVPLLVLKSKI